MSNQAQQYPEKAPYFPMRHNDKWHGIYRRIYTEDCEMILVRISDFIPPVGEVFFDGIGRKVVQEPEFVTMKLKLAQFLNLFLQKSVHQRRSVILIFQEFQK